MEDSGKGIDEKELMMIFERFYKTDEFEQGSGLGLAISKVIIERLSGRIKVHSEKGKGSCFTVILSLADALENSHVELNSVVAVSRYRLFLLSFSVDVNNHRL